MVAFPGEANQLAPRLYNFFVLNSAGHEIFPVHKCLNANNCWHFNVYERENSSLGLSEPKKAEFLDIFIFRGI